MPNRSDRQKLRADAEARYARERATRAPGRPASALLHELQVHQIELEMQNEELRRDQLELETAHERYVDLYEFAPVGYLTLSGVGAIREVNLNGAGLLGVERARLIGRNFAAFVGPDHSDRWHRHRLDVASSGGHGTLDLGLLRGDGSSFDAHVSCRRHRDPEDPLAMRVAITEDVAQKRADAHALDTKRMGALQVAMGLLPIGVTLVQVVGPLAYVADLCELRIIDVSNPDAPVEVGYLRTPSFTSVTPATSGASSR